jgi:hypothetical protein
VKPLGVPCSGQQLERPGGCGSHREELGLSFANGTEGRESGQEAATQPSGS